MQTTSAFAADVTYGESLRKRGYRTAPDQETTAWPPGIPYIVGNEVCERFSFYGMKALLFVHLTSLYVLAGVVKGTAEDLATSTTHFFNASVYALPMIGAILADRLLGKYQTILFLSLVYCAGHAVLSVAENSLLGMYLGLGLIAIGSGGIKPCVSANVGDQFGKGNWFRVRAVFQIFYFSVNLGSFFSTLSIPYTMEHFGPRVAFAIPGILMFFATLIFWMGRKRFVHVPAKPGGKIGLLDTLTSVVLFLVIGHLFFTAGYPWWVMLLTSLFFLSAALLLFSLRQRWAADDGFLAITLHALRHMLSRRTAGLDLAGLQDGLHSNRASGSEAGLPALARSRFWAAAVTRFGLEATEGPVAVLKIISVFFLVSIFWALFDQTASSWIRQAEMMNLTLWGDTKILANQIQSLNPLLVMGFIPLMNWIYSLVDKMGIQTTPLRRMTMGMFIAALSFVAVALLQMRINARGPGTVWFGWQVIPFLLLTVSEIMVSITGLEFAYTQAPNRMKSTIMGFWLLTIALGNVFVALLARFSHLPLVDFFWLFAGLMAAAATLFGVRSYFYVQKDYIQE